MLGDSQSFSLISQVRVGKAIYKAGSLFNHSCQPNVHAYFLSRTLCIRTTKSVAAGCELELSYGPQVTSFWKLKADFHIANHFFGFCTLNLVFFCVQNVCDQASEKHKLLKSSYFYLKHASSHKCPLCLRHGQITGLPNFVLKY